MARLKEQSRVERERRHLEKASKRKLQDDEEDIYIKKSRNFDLPIVTVSDNSDGEVEEVYEDQEEKSDGSPHSHSSGKRSRSVSRRGEVSVVFKFY